VSSRALVACFLCSLVVWGAASWLMFNQPAKQEAVEFSALADAASVDGFPPATGSLDDSAVPDVVATTRIVRPPSLTGVAGGLPIVLPINTRPLAGAPFTLGWTTRPTAPFPNPRTALLVTLAQPPAPSLIQGGRGGMLQVPPDLVFVPGTVPWLTQNNGTVRLDITFIPQLVGLKVWMQLAVSDARVPAGLTVTPMVALVVGNR